ncbi:hypothetical protein L914_04828 [Phytophthora nicotianae]|uniref:Uncharacterized protein n=1 Tax=Phytophthora nicotianae TaxID=4792 RepID=W2NUG2_PHYNI|nr:hypothetical protein L914_04828 [Phytophthora nicotianae]
MTPNVSVFPRLYKDMHAWITLCADSGEVKARLQEDERMEEEEYFLSLSKALPVGQVQAAALRNYQAAGKLRWKKLMFQSIAEQQQLDEEMAESSTLGACSSATSLPLQAEALKALTGNMHSTA